MMRPRSHLAWTSTAGIVLLLSGCHHKAPARTAVAPPPPVSAGPVMVSVPPPTHRSSPAAEAASIAADIPVVKPVKPPRKIARRAPNAASVPTAPAAPPPTPTATVAPPAAVNLGQLTAGNDNISAARNNAAQALRTQHDRLLALPAALQSSHSAEIEQVRRFLRSGSDSLTGADYAAAVGLATKAKVLLDDLQK